MKLNPTLHALTTGWLVGSMGLGTYSPRLMAATYYVNPAGSNSSTNATSPSSPWKTLTFAMNAAHSGDVLVLAPGTYNAANGETFPIALKSGVTVQGNAVDTFVTSTSAVFAVNGDLTGAWLSGLTLSGAADRALVEVTSSDEDSIDLTLSDLAVSGGTAPVMSLNHNGGGLTFHPTFEDNVVSGRDLLSFSESFSGDSELVPVFQGNTLSGGATGMAASIQISSAWVDLRPTFSQNNLSQSSMGLDLDFVGSGDSRTEHGLGLNTVVSGNTFSGSEYALNLYFSDVRGLELNSDLTLSSNVLTNGAWGLIYQDSRYMDNTNLIRSTTISGNTAESGGGSASQTFAYFYDNDYGTVNLDSKLTVTGNTISGFEQVVEIDITSVSTSKISVENSFTSNEVTDSNGPAYYSRIYNLSGSILNRSELVSGNTVSLAEGVSNLVASSYSSSHVEEEFTVTNNRGSELNEYGIRTYTGDIDQGWQEQVFTISDNTISGVTGAGIDNSLSSVSSSYLGQDFTISRNSVSEIEWIGIRNYAYSVSSSRYNQNLTISDNTISNTGSDGIYMELSSLSSASVDSKYEIHHNTISGAEGNGIFVVNDSFSSSYARLDQTISQNTISSVAQNGILLSFTTVSSNTAPMDHYILGNVITDTGAKGIYAYIYDLDYNLEPLTVVAAGNTVSGATEEGILLSLTSGSYNAGDMDLSIVGNMISESDIGASIRMTNYSYNRGALHSTVMNNDISNVSVGIDTEAGIFYDSRLVLHQTVSGNTVSAATNTGIDVSFYSMSSQMQSQWLNLNGNVIDGFGETGLFLSHPGVNQVVEGSGSVADNLITSGLGVGMELDLPGAIYPFLSVSGNTVTDNGLGVLVRGADAAAGAPDFGGGAEASPGNNHFANNRSVGMGGGLGNLENFENGTAVVVSALNNYWGSTSNSSIDAAITDNEEGAGEVLFAPFSTAEPTRAAAGTLSAELIDDVAPFGPSAHDMVRYTLTLTGTGTAGCAAAEALIQLGNGAAVVADSVQLSQGSSWLHGQEVHAWLGDLASGSSRAATVVFDAHVHGDTCEAVTMAVTASCQPVGTLAVTGKSSESISNPASIPVTTTYYRDVDGDGFGSTALTACTGQPVGYVSMNGDCNDESAAINPAAVEVADDGVDSDCTGTEICYLDGDGDGYRPDNSTHASTDLSCNGTGDGKASDPIGDCNDEDALTHETAVYYMDEDGDGVGSEAMELCVSTMPSGHATEGGDNCPDVANPSQADADEDGWGDACDTTWQTEDDDKDGVDNGDDNCPAVANAHQDDADEDGNGDACDDDYGTDDSDSDGALNMDDNCPDVANAEQTDLDEDGIGDACDLDADGDDMSASADCDDQDSSVAETMWAYSDVDGDGIGNADDLMVVCGSTLPDGYVSTKGDNCPDVANADQADNDADGLGDACDVAETPDGVIVGGGGCSVNPGAAPESSELNMLALAALLLPAIRRRRRQS